MRNDSAGSRPRFSIGDLLKPHSTALVFGLLAAVGEGVANLLSRGRSRSCLMMFLRRAAPCTAG
jgi:hypothetical protein